MFGVEDMHVLAVTRLPDQLDLAVETAADLAGCPGCGVVAVGHGRRSHRVAEAPVLRGPTVVVWRTRIWRCREPACPIGTFSEVHDQVALRSRLTRPGGHLGHRRAGP